MRILLVIVTLTIGQALPGAEGDTNCIAIYLLDRPLAQPWPKLDTAHIKDLRPVSPPVLADEDFLSFDTTNHSFVVSGASAKRLALTIWSLARKDAPGWGEQVPFVYHTGEFELIPVPAPFVLHAGGKPIYAGAFYTSASSAGFSGPVIMAEETFIKTNVSNSARFSFWIQAGYPVALSGTPDPRNDSRIASAVQKLLARRKIER